MSETNQIDYVPDSKKKDKGDVPVINCKNCFHSDLCHWFNQVHNLSESMKQAKIKIKLPYDPTILAQNCSAFVTKKGVIAPPPEVTKDGDEPV